MKTCRLTSSVRMGAPDSWGQRHGYHRHGERWTDGQASRGGATHLTPGIHVVVGLGRVHFGQQEAGLRSTTSSVGHHQAGFPPRLTPASLPLKQRRSRCDPATIRAATGLVAPT